MIDARAIVDELREFVGQRPGRRLLAVYVFGSSAKGRLRPDSDIDVAVLASEALDSYELFRRAQRIATVLHRDVDLIDLQRANTVLRAQIVHSGERVHVGDEKAVAEFEMYAFSDYARLNEERKPVLDAYADRYGG